jgi:putative transposase
MARIPRVVAVDTPHHITQRGNARRTVFETDSDRLAYLSLLTQYSRHYDLSILGYCLMPNHVHLIAVPHRTDWMARALHFAHGRYATFLNARQQRTGHVWQGRYYSCALDENHFWAALRYTERNPVRAGLSETPEQYRWSTAALHCDGARFDGSVDLAAFRDRWDPADWRSFIALDTADQIEAADIRRRTQTGRPLGSPEFLDRLGRNLGRSFRINKGGRPPKEAAALLQNKSGERRVCPQVFAA